MRELSLHILDIIQNSIAAQAEKIELIIDENLINNELVIRIVDDGCGMSEELQRRVLDPFVTSRTTRKVGLGLSLFKAAASRCGGDLELNSTLNEGTEVIVRFKYDHLDRAPLGDIVGTVLTILTSNPDLRLIYRHKFNGDQFLFDTREIKEELDDVKINQPLILNWLEEYLFEKIEDLRR